MDELPSIGTVTFNDKFAQSDSNEMNETRFLCKVMIEVRNERTNIGSIHIKMYSRL